MGATFGRGAKGDLIAVLQSGLAARGTYTGKVDGDYGGATDNAVRALQALGKRAISGRVGEVDWRDATGLAWPELFDRCLQLTSRFEGHGYGTVAGNFDGAGLTWGIIGFTLAGGELRALLLEIASRAPQLLASAFGAATPELLVHLRDDSAAQRAAWADSISQPPKKQGVAEPWRGGFMRLGAEPLVQEIQRREARRKYFEGALATAKRLGLASERGVALCFDVHVQNGGVKPATEAAYAAEVAKLGTAAGEEPKRRALARLVAASAKAAFRQDVLDRKDCIASGKGTVHKESFDVDAWALDAG
jgi:putative peptidoglycan binding protein